MPPRFNGGSITRIRALVDDMEHFEFDDVLIQRLLGNKDEDACGVLSECRNERCPCALLGRDGEFLQTWHREDRWVACIGGREDAADAPAFADLGDAVRAAQAAYLARRER